jgi:subtilisin family serine protease
MRNPRPTRRRLWTVSLLTAAVTGLVAFGGTAAAAPAEGNVVSADSPDAVANSYIVMLKQAASSDVAGKASNLAAQFQGTVERTYTAALHGFATSMSATQARRLAAHPDVAYVQQNQTIRLSATQLNPPSWGLDRIDQRDLPLDNSYTYSTIASNVHAYVIDTGIRRTHTDLGGRAITGIDEVTPGGTADDCNGHGTHVSGTIGGTSYGVAKGVTLVAVRVLDCSGSGTTAGVAAGVDWVTVNAIKPAVANMSLGGSADPTLDSAVANSIASGVTYGIAAGNSSADACTFSPARVSTAITVGATDISDNRASFSNFGTCVHIFAPGVNITSAWNTNDTATNTISGTSMATPHVVGAAALILSANPSMTPAQVQSTMKANGTPNKISNPGAGSPNTLLFTGAGGPPPPPGPCPAVTNSNPVPIPDLGTATSTITISGCTGNASAASTIEVHLRHTFIGDLVVDLIAPNGTVVNLQNRSGGSTHDINTIYTRNLSGQAANGTWTLRIRDAAAVDSGTLDSWTLDL